LIAHFVEDFIGRHVEKLLRPRRRPCNR
jgi:hypothetical protein